jgi:hypothetical protein
MRPSRQSADALLIHPPFSVSHIIASRSNFSSLAPIILTWLAWTLPLCSPIPQNTGCILSWTASVFASIFVPTPCWPRSYRVPLFQWVSLYLTPILHVQIFLTDLHLQLFNSLIPHIEHLHTNHPLFFFILPWQPVVLSRAPRTPAACLATRPNGIVGDCPIGKHFHFISSLLVSHSKVSPGLTKDAVPANVPFGSVPDRLGPFGWLIVGTPSNWRLLSHWWFYWGPAHLCGSVLSKVALSS